MENSKLDRIEKLILAQGQRLGELDRIEELLLAQGKVLESHGQILESHSQRFEEQRESIGRLVVSVDGLREDVGELKEDVSGLKLDVGELKEDVSGLKLDVGELKENVGALEEQGRVFVSQLFAINDSLENRIATTDGIDKMLTAMDRLAGKYVHIETEGAAHTSGLKRHEDGLKNHEHRIVKLERATGVA